MDSTSSPSSASRPNQFNDRHDIPATTQEKASQKKTGSDMDDWEIMEGDDDWEFVPNEQVISDQAPDEHGWHMVEHENVLSEAHKRATSPGNADNDWPVADPSVRNDGDGSDISQAQQDDEDELLDRLYGLVSEGMLANMPEAIQFKQDLKNAHIERKRLMREAREANHGVCSQEVFFNFLSGANAFLMCFGAGTLTSSGVGIPLVGWAMSTALWALTERISPMIRTTTWSNPHADKTYPLLGNLIQNAARNAVRQLGGMQARISHSSRRDGSNSSMAAQLRDVGVQGFLKAWLGKMVTEDLPYYFYSLCYGTRYSIIARMNLAPTSFASLITLLIAGTLAGACTASTMHGLRRLRCEPGAKGNRFKAQKITKTMAMWENDARLLKMYERIFKVAQNDPDSGLQWKGRKISDKDMALLGTFIQRAQQKSRFFSSIGFEIKAMFNLKRGTAGLRGEVAGKLSEFIAGFLAKGSVLGISTGWNYAVTIPMLAATESVERKTGLMWGQYVMLIVAFNSRKEFELAYRGILGIGLGSWDILTKNYPCLQISSAMHPESEGPGSVLRSTNSTAELMTDYKKRARPINGAPKRRGTMDGAEEDVNDDDDDNDNSGNTNTVEDDIDNRLTTFNMANDEVVANGSKDGKSLVQIPKQGRADSSDSPRSASERTSHANKADAAETVDNRIGSTSRGKENKHPVDESLDISDSSESSE